MGELQCTLEFFLELHKFINVDLFQRGFYQVRCTLKASSKIPVKIEVNLPKNSSCSLVFPACIVNGTAVSKTFQILYKNEEVILDDIIIFKVHTFLEGHRVRESLLKADFQINVELWFTDQSFGPDQHNSIHCVSTRTLLLHFDPAKGLHHHVPLLFDYFHLCAVTITIHASLIVLCHPYLRKGVMVSHQSSSLQKNSKQTFLTGSPCLSSKKSHSSLETVLFGPQIGRPVASSARLYRAHIVHWELCSLLLSAYYNLCKKLLEYMTLLPPWKKLTLESFENSSYLKNLSVFAKECYKEIKTSPLAAPKDQLFGSYEGMETEEEFLIRASSDITNICSALILLWQKFLESVIGSEKVRQHLSRQRHFQRVKRFSEAFFIIERTRDSALAPCDSSVGAYQEVSECLRKSPYLNLLPPLEVECIDFDGDLTTLPIFYEEQYQETTRSSHNNHSSQTELAVSLSDVNFLVEENVSKKEDSDATRRNSQGSLGQKYRSPDISATPTSPSAYSWCPESISPVSAKSNYLTSKKSTLKDKLFHNFCSDVDGNNEDYCVPPSSFTRINNKIAVRSKMKLRSRTVNFLRQLKKPQSSQEQNSVILLGVKKIETCSVSSGFSKSSGLSLVIESGIRHSQSTLSVMSTLYAEGNSSIPNSESMPDLTSGFVPPPPPPPSQKSKLVNDDTAHTRSNFLTVNQEHSSNASYQNVENSASSDNSSEKGHVSDQQKKDDTSQKVSSPLVTNVNLNHNKILNSDMCQELYNYLNPLKPLNSAFPEPISSQPSKSASGYIFDGIKNKKTNKFDPPPPLSLTSEELNSTVNNSNVYEICPPSPPVQFKDPPKTDQLNQDQSKSTEREKPLKLHKKKLSAKSNLQSNDSCLTSIICQGTLFFPRPPAEFGDDVCESSSSNEINDVRIISKKENSVSSKENSVSPKEKNVSKLDDSSTIKNEDLKEKNKKNLQKNTTFLDTKCTILDLLADPIELPDSDISVDSGESSCSYTLSASSDKQQNNNLVVSTSSEEDASVIRSSIIGTESISFLKAKEEFRKQLQYPWLWYSDLPSLASDVPYFQCDSDLRAFSPEGMHLVVCVHGLDGNSADFRLVRTYLELGLPTVNFEFLMSERNQGETFDDFETMTDRLVSEISYYIEVYGLKPSKISFIGHSLGNIIIRSAVTRPEMKPYLSKLHTFLSLSGPHLGTLYNSSGLVNMGMWFVQKLKKSGSLLQLAMKDSSNLRQTFLYKLSQKSSLVHFRNILLFGSSQDRYVPLHSARIELCKSALKDTSLQGVVYREMVTNLMKPIIENPNISLLRYDVHHALPTSANSLIGRAAHVAVLDSELFIEKFLAVCGLQFFT